MRLVCGAIWVPLRAPFAAAVPNPARRPEAQRADQKDETECEKRHADSTLETSIRLTPAGRSSAVESEPWFRLAGPTPTASVPAQAQVGVEISPRGFRADEDRPYRPVVE
jgi:hypothetical protein